MSTPRPVIALDGTAASGKSTVGRELGSRLGFVYVNTGVMYRAVTWWLLQQKVDVNRPDAVARALDAVEVRVWIEEGQARLTLDGMDPLPHTREGVVNDNVSAVSAVPKVREVLVARQQALAEQVPLIMEGRDIGTVVFPETPYKYYIDAAPEIRAARRRAQGEADAIAKRDKIDSTRQASPLKAAADARQIDSGLLNAEQIVSLILEELAARGLEPAKEALALPATP